MMTTPEERTKSLRWAWELLAEIDADPDTGDDLRARARAVATEFPDPGVLQSLIASNAERLPTPYADAIEAARNLFLDIQLGTTGSPATRKGVLYTLRHYPPAGSATGLARGRFAFGIEDWLARAGTA
jgi:hypothetical protein